MCLPKCTLGVVVSYRLIFYHQLKARLRIILHPTSMFWLYCLWKTTKKTFIPMTCLVPMMERHSWTTCYILASSKLPLSIYSECNPSTLWPYLQDFSGDVLLAALALDAKHGVVVHLTVGDPIPGGTNRARKQIRDSAGDQTNFIEVNRQDSASAWGRCWV